MNCSAIFAALIPLQKNQQLLTRFASVIAGDILPFERLFVNSVDFRSFRTMLAGVAHHHDEAGRCLASKYVDPAGSTRASLVAIPDGMSCRVNYYRRRTGQNNDDIKSQMSNLIILEI